MSRLDYVFDVIVPGWAWVVDIPRGVLDVGGRRRYMPEPIFDVGEAKAIYAEADL